MPYLTKSRREIIKPHLNPLLEWVGSGLDLCSGDLNYIFTKICISYFSRGRNKCYAGLNDIRGALLNASDEFYRRVGTKYEDTKIASNGDVYNEITK
jgi:hypothetical protein